MSDGGELTYEPADSGSVAQVMPVAHPGVMSSEATSGHVKPAHGGTLTPVRSTERAMELVEAKRRKKAARVAAGVRKAMGQVPDAPGVSVWDFYEYAAEQHASNAIDPSSRNSIQSLQWIDRTLVPEPVKHAVDVAPTGDLAELVAAWRQAKADNPTLAARAAGLVRGGDNE